MATTRRRRTHAGLLAAGAALLLSCADDDPSEPRTLLELPGAAPGELVGLVANDETQSVEWIDRLDGTIHSLQLNGGRAAGDPSEIASVDIGNDGEQRGLLGQVIIDGRRFASWTEPETFELVVGEIVDGAVERRIWSAGEAGGGAIGGVLGELDGRVLVGVGRNTAFDATTRTGGAMLTLDPDGRLGQEPTVISTGYTNPWAFTTVAVDDGNEVWVADNAAGPDPENADVDDIERIGRADLLADRADMTTRPEPGRAPAAMIELPDGRLGICGFLDDELLAYQVVDGADVDPTNPATIDLTRSDVVPAEPIMPCLTGAAVFDDGTIVTVALGDPGLRLVILEP